MIKRFSQWLQRTIHPLSTIAQELTTIRELYELELASRPTPVIRVTEKPKKGDTVVTYGTELEEDKPPTFSFIDDREDDEDNVHNS